MDDDTDSDERVGLAEAMDFVRGEVEAETEDFEGDVPNHAARLLSANVSDLLQTLTNIEMADASENIESPSEDDISDAVVEDAVDILMGLGALCYEYDLDLSSAFAARMQTIEDYKAFEAAVEDAESEEAVMDAMDEHLDEDQMPPMGGGMPSVGENVDADDYDHDQEGKAYQ